MSAVPTLLEYERTTRGYRRIGTIEKWGKVVKFADIKPE
jgi:hypothetical protein